VGFPAISPPPERAGPSGGGFPSAIPVRTVRQCEQAAGRAGQAAGQARSGAATGALGGDPRPVFLVAGVTVMVAAAGGWAGGLRAAASHPVRRIRSQA